jgi:hypothetical protein
LDSKLTSAVGSDSRKLKIRAETSAGAQTLIVLSFDAGGGFLLVTAIFNRSPAAAKMWPSTCRSRGHVPMSANRSSQQCRLASKREATKAMEVEPYRVDDVDRHI